MKTSLVLSALLLAPATAFAPAAFVSRSPAASSSSAQQPRYMFSGAGGAGKPMDEEEAAKIEQAAKAMGMSVEEYQLGAMARDKLNADLTALRVSGGDDNIKVTRDGHNPPQSLEVTITEAGKAKGKEVVAKEVIAALKTSGEEAKRGRAEAQKSMMAFIGEELKKRGKA